MSKRSLKPLGRHLAACAAARPPAVPFGQLYMGQPSARTHPHLLAEGELMPGVHKREFAGRRAALMRAAYDSLRKRGRGSDADGAKVVAVMCAPPLRHSAPDVPYVFRQDSNMTYLCGLLEPSSVLVMCSDPGAAHGHRAFLFVSKRTAHSDLWEGPRAGVDGAAALTGVDEAHDACKLPGVLRRLCRGGGKRTLLLFDTKMLAGRAERAVTSLIADNVAAAHPDSLIGMTHRLRWRKSAAERSLMRSAAAAGCAALNAAIAAGRPGMVEAELAAHAELAARQAGARGLAYPPVVASGARNNIIHYMTCGMPIADSDLILMDAGADCWGYVSDITRTWPANGSFSPDALAAYEMLHELHGKLLRHVADVRPLTLNQLYVEQMKLTAAALVQLGALSAGADADTITSRLETVCPHHVSHYLGMDVHDTATVPRTLPIEPDVAITVEPGLYFPESVAWVPRGLRGVGMRIEDDLLITEGGAELLTAAAPSDAAGMAEVARVRRR